MTTSSNRGLVEALEKANSWLRSADHDAEYREARARELIDHALAYLNSTADVGVVEREAELIAAFHDGMMQARPMSQRTAAASKVAMALGREYIGRLASLSLPGSGDKGSALQPRVAAWMQECFGAEVAADIRERCDRHIEEVFELAQALDYDPGRVATLRDYVWGRPRGEPAQEVGGVMLTLAALCAAAALDMDAAALAEITRVEQPEMIEKIRIKQASKRGLNTPLPTGESGRPNPSPKDPTSC